MFKIFAAVIATISCFLTITFYTTKLPAINDKVNSNAEALADNSTQIEVINAKKIVLHNVTITSENFSGVTGNYLINFIILNNDESTIDEDNLIQVFENFGSYEDRLLCTGRFYYSDAGAATSVTGIYYNNGFILTVSRVQEPLEGVSISVSNIEINDNIIVLL